MDPLSLVSVLLLKIYFSTLALQCHIPWLGLFGMCFSLSFWRWFSYYKEIKGLPNSMVVNRAYYLKKKKLGVKQVLIKNT